MDCSEHEPAILDLCSKIEDGIKHPRNCKSTGLDDISKEMMRQIGDNGTDILHAIYNKIQYSREWQHNWTTSAFLTLHQKGSTRKCYHYRITELILLVNQALIYNFNYHLKPFILRQIPQEQYGFVQGKGTREQVLNVRQVVEKAAKLNISMLMYFLNNSKSNPWCSLETSLKGFAKDGCSILSHPIDQRPVQQKSIMIFNDYFMYRKGSDRDVYCLHSYLTYMKDI